MENTVQQKVKSSSPSSFLPIIRPLTMFSQSIAKHSSGTLLRLAPISSFSSLAPHRSSLTATCVQFTSIPIAISRFRRSFRPSGPLDSRIICIFARLEIVCARTTTTNVFLRYSDILGTTGEKSELSLAFAAKKYWSFFLYSESE